MTALLQLTGITKDYNEQTPVLNGVDLEVVRGESVAITGPSGCGKSTLLNIIGTLDTPSGGEVLFEGENILAWNERETAAFRNRRIGWVFQSHHLLPQCSILENVLAPTLVHAEKEGVLDRAERLLERVDLGHRKHHRPGELSGGERQRAAVVRALINRPALLLADEPTGSLNREGSEALTTLLLELNREEELTLLVVTHASGVARRMERTLDLRNGVLVQEFA